MSYPFIHKLGPYFVFQREVNSDSPRLRARLRSLQASNDSCMYTFYTLSLFQVKHISQARFKWLDALSENIFI